MPSPLIIEYGRVYVRFFYSAVAHFSVMYPYVVVVVVAGS